MKPTNLFSKEKIIVGLVIFLAIFFAKFPTIYNALNTPKGYWYPKQTSWFDAWDINFQVSYIRYGERHGLNLINTYTTTPHPGVFIYQYYTGLGVVNRLMHLDPFLLFHLSSVITGIILLLITYCFIVLFFRYLFFNISTYIFMVLGGGLGWLRILDSSADMNIAGFTGIYAMERGHEALITLLLLLCFASILKFLQTHAKKYLNWSVLTGFICFTIHPPFALLILIIGVAVGWWDYCQSRNRTLFVFPISLTILYLLYYAVVYSKLLGNPGFSGVLGQSLFSVDSLSLISGWGALSIFIFWMLIFHENKKQETVYLKLLFIIQLVLLLSPLGFHLYFAKNLYAWGVLLGFLGIKNFISKDRYQIRVILLIVILSLFTRLYIFNILMHPDKKNQFFFLTQTEGKALEFMDRLPADSGILSLYRIGNYIPAFSDNKVYYGHKFQTPNANFALEQAKLFYTVWDEEKQRNFLKDNNIQYVYYGLEEALARKQEKLPIDNPFPYFSKTYEENGFLIYKI